MFSCTSNRDPAQQTCPWLKKMPFTIPSMASSRGASSKTMFAAFPPSSRVSRLDVPATCRAIDRPTSVDPVNATLSTSSCATSAAPVARAPVIMFTTPGGSSACCSISAKSSAVSEVVSAGLSTTVLPVASVGEEPGGNERDIDIPRFFDRLAVVEGFCDRKFPRTLLHEPGNPIEVLTAVTRRHPRPNGVVGATRGCNSGGDILLGGGRDAREVLFGRR